MCWIEKGVNWPFERGIKLLLFTPIDVYKSLKKLNLQEPLSPGLAIVLCVNRAGLFQFILYISNLFNDIVDQEIFIFLCTVGTRYNGLVEGWGAKKKKVPSITNIPLQRIRRSI
jgi:hypothetical protein